MNQQRDGLDEQIFVALQAYEALKSHHLNRAASSERLRLSFTEIMHCARAPYAAQSIVQLGVINQSLDYRRKYRFVLQNLARIYNPKQVAASTADSLLKRDAGEFSLHIKNVAEQHASVSLRLKQAYEHSGKALHLHCEADGAFVTISLKRTNEDSFFASLDQACKEYNALVNPASEMYVVYE
jgi:hypothetical protein